MSRQMAVDYHRQRTDLPDAAILISDLEIDDVRQLMPPLTLCVSAGIRGLFIVAQKISDNVIGFLQANQNPELLQIAAMKTPGSATINSVNSKTWPW